MQLVGYHFYVSVSLAHANVFIYYITYASKKSFFWAIHPCNPISKIFNAVNPSFFLSSAGDGVTVALLPNCIGIFHINCYDIISEYLSSFFE
jgi:hypothetical protein